MGSFLRRLSLGYISAVGGAALVLAIVALPPLRTLRPSTLGIQPGAATRLNEERWAKTLEDGLSVTQPLSPLSDRLSEVDIYVNSYGHVSLAPLKLEMLDGDRVIRTSVSTDQSPAVEEANFPFEPIGDSGQRHLSMRLSMPGAAKQTAASPYVVIGNQPSTNMRADGADQQVALPLRLRYGSRRPIWDQFDAMIARASQYHPRPFKGNGIRFVLAMALVSASLVILYLARISREPAGSEQGRVLD